MIGNDVIDLEYTRKTQASKRFRFLRKVFTLQELVKIEDADNSEQMIWVLWSQKESIYKIIARNTGRRFFAPKKLDTQASNFQIESHVNEYSITTIAKISRKQTIHYHTFSLDNSDYSTQHFTTYQKLLAHYSRLYQLPEDKLSIQKNEIGVPFLYYHHLQQPALISIAHHGHYGSYAIAP